MADWARQSIGTYFSLFSLPLLDAVLPKLTSSFERESGTAGYNDGFVRSEGEGTRGMGEGVGEFKTDPA